MQVARYKQRLCLAWFLIGAFCGAVAGLVCGSVGGAAMSRAYVNQRLAEIGSAPRKQPSQRAKPQRRTRTVWLFKGLRPAMPGSAVITCDCHPDLQGTANNYVARARLTSVDADERATWFDVRNAFITGYHIALEYHGKRNDR